MGELTVAAMSGLDMYLQFLFVKRCLSECVVSIH